MAIPYLTKRALDNLRRSIPDNLQRYRTRGFDEGYLEELENPATRILENSSDITDLGYQLKLSNGNLGPGKAKYDPENSRLVHEALHDLTPLQARDERIWSYLCHVTCSDYVRNRWPVPDNRTEKDQEANIINHYFIKRGAPSVERDNAISRLWWSAHIASKAEGFDLDEALEVLFYRQIVREHLVGRPGVTANPGLFTAILRRLRTSYDTEKKMLFEEERFMPFMKAINDIGGVQLLEVLGPEDLDELIEDTLSNRLKFTDV
ncbi:MAG: hypothetical protein CME26_16085 [Gemmatimonadetes bacterium]|nr:hypothetical protein [Gemmatimonadota bacterium]|tara:strand:+ start:5583 stop:6371 length:789 start_codon:yes stop_codon:yes gene_type:complete